jgi:hypothetical protein
MPRYLFDLTGGHLSGLPDKVGTELEGIEAVADEVASTLGELAKDALPDGNRKEFKLVARDQEGTPVVRASLSFVMERLV